MSVKNIAFERKTVTKIYTLTDEHRAELPAWHARWVDVPLRTAPQTEEDRESVRLAVRGLYRVAKLKPPPSSREVFCASPIGAAIAASIASGAWWLRKNPKR